MLYGAGQILQVKIQGTEFLRGLIVIDTNAPTDSSLISTTHFHRLGDMAVQGRIRMVACNKRPDE